MLYKYLALIHIFITINSTIKTCFTTNANNVDTQSSALATSFNISKTTDKNTNPSDSIIIAPLNLTYINTTTVNNNGRYIKPETKVPILSFNCSKNIFKKSTLSGTSSTQIVTLITTNTLRNSLHNHKILHSSFLSKINTESNLTALELTTAQPQIAQINITQVCTKNATSKIAIKTTPISIEANRKQTLILNEPINNHPSFGIKNVSQNHQLASNTSTFFTRTRGEMFSGFTNNPFGSTIQSSVALDKTDLQNAEQPGYITKSETPVQRMPSNSSIESRVELPQVPSVLPKMTNNLEVTLQLPPAASIYKGTKVLNKTEQTNQVDKIINEMKNAREEITNNYIPEITNTLVSKKRVLATRSHFQSKITPDQRISLSTISTTSGYIKANVTQFPNFEQTTTIEGLSTTFASRGTSSISKAPLPTTTSISNTTPYEESNTIYSLTDSISEANISSPDLIPDTKNTSTILKDMATGEVKVDLATIATRTTDFPRQNSKKTLSATIPTIETTSSTLNTNRFMAFAPTTKKNSVLSVTSISQAATGVLSTSTFSNTEKSTQAIITPMLMITPASITTPTTPTQTMITSQTTSTILTSSQAPATINPIANIASNHTISPIACITNTAAMPIPNITSVTHGTTYTPTIPSQSLTTPLVKSASVITAQAQTTQIPSHETIREESATTLLAAMETPIPVSSTSEHLPTEFFTSSIKSPSSITEQLIKATYSTSKSSRKPSLINFLRSILTKVPKSPHSITSSISPTSSTTNMGENTSDSKILATKSTMCDSNSETPVVFTMVQSTSEPYFTSTPTGVSPHNEHHSHLIDFVRNHPVQSVVTFGSIACVTTFSIFDFVSLLNSIDKN